VQRYEGLAGARWSLEVHVRDAAIAQALLHLLKLWIQAWIVVEDLLCLLGKILTSEFISIFKFEHLCVLWHLELSSQILDDALQQVKGIVVEVGDHERLMA